MKLSKKRFAAALLTVTTPVLLAGCGVTNTQDNAAANSGSGPFYGSEKQLQIIVPFDAGGASDTFTRQLAKDLSKHLAGQPEIVIENVPGGAQKEGLNAFERTEHNGLNMAMGSGGLITSTHFDKAGIQFDLADYEPVMGFGGGIVVFGSTEAGITSLKDLQESTQPVFYGGLELNAAESVRLFALEEMGVDRLKPLMGYDGGESVTAALMRGELSVGYSTASHYLQNVKPLEEKGDVVPLMVQGYVEAGKVVRDPAFPDVPTMPEAYEKLTGEKPEGTGWDVYTAITATQTNLLRTYWVHGDAPEPAQRALNEAAEKLVQDEAFLKEAAKLLGEDPRPLTGEELDASLSHIEGLSTGDVQWVEDYIASYQ